MYNADFPIVRFRYVIISMVSSYNRRRVELSAMWSTTVCHQAMCKKQIFAELLGLEQLVHLNEFLAPVE
jgi:hypothetical protein